MSRKTELSPKVRPIRDIRIQATAPPARQTSWLAKLTKALKQPRVRFFLILVAVLLTAAFARNYMQARNELVHNDPIKLAAKIGEFVELPLDEAPTLATVKDASKLRTQSFFKHTQDGDKVLIYAKAGKAVIYRPSTKKVVQYMPINLADSPKS